MKIKRSTGILLLLILSTSLAAQIATPPNTPSLHTTSTTSTTSDTPKIDWMSFEQAYELNKTHPKLIFVDVYTDWCGWCKRMDATTFAVPEVAAYMNQHFYAVKLNAERQDTVVIDGVVFVNSNPGNGRGSHQLAIELLRGQMSYPSYTFLNEKSQLLTVIPGYQPAKEFEPILHYFGDGAYTTEKWEDFRARFQENSKQ